MGYEQTICNKDSSTIGIILGFLLPMLRCKATAKAHLTPGVTLLLYNRFSFKYTTLALQQFQ